MGAIGYVNNWRKFLGKSQHWRYVLAELNKLAYFKAYKESISEAEFDQCLHHSAKWLIHAQKNGSTNGFATYYYNSGWTSDYPETTGYIIPTLLRYSSYANSQWSEQAKESAISAGEWLLTIQREDGGWPGGYIDQMRPSVVFNSGQILRGMLSLYELTGEEKWKTASLKAINWIWNQLDKEGRFSTNDFMGAIRVYGTYVVVPIIEWSAHFPEHKQEWFKQSQKHLNWVLTQQNELGWFSNCDNTLHKNDRPIVHTIAYTVDGMWNAGLLLDNEDYKQSAIVPARVLATEFLSRGILNGRYNSSWNGSENFIPSGGAQLAITWHSMYEHTGELIWKHAFEKMNKTLCAIVLRGAKQGDDCFGALPGSFPMWGRYEPFGLPNWATKYLLDSLMNER